MGLRPNARRPVLGGRRALDFCEHRRRALSHITTVTVHLQKTSVPAHGNYEINTTASVRETVQEDYMPKAMMENMAKRGPDPEATPEKVLRAIRDHYAPVVGTQDIADEVDVARQTASRRLDQLEDDGLVETDKIGRSRIWWLTTDGKRHLKNLED